MSDKIKIAFIKFGGLAAGGTEKSESHGPVSKAS